MSDHEQKSFYALRPASALAPENLTHASTNVPGVTRKEDKSGNCEIYAKHTISLDR